MPYSRSGLSAPAKQKAHMFCLVCCQYHLSPDRTRAAGCQRIASGSQNVGDWKELEASPVSLFVLALNMISR